LLFEPGNLEDAVRATKSVLTETDMRARLGQAARCEVESWSWESSIECVRQVYRDTIQEFRRTRSALTYRQRMARALTVSLVTGIEKVSTRKKKVSKKRKLARV
jgi:hypothetical protein